MHVTKGVYATLSGSEESCLFRVMDSSVAANAASA